MRKLDTDKLPDALSRRRIVQGVAGLTSLSLAGCQGLFGGDGDDGDGGDGTDGGDGADGTDGGDGGDGTDGGDGGDGGDGTDGGDGGDGTPVERGPVDDPVLNRVTVDPADIVEGGTFRTAIESNVSTFDAPWSGAATDSLVYNLMYEGMIAVDSRGEIYPWLAESYERVGLQDIDRSAYEPYMITAAFDDEGVPQVEDQIVVRHPDNDPSSGEGQFLTVNETGDAAADGTFGMHFRFQLHEGMTFHNGEEITAQNVVDSYYRVAGSPLAGQLFDSLLHIEANGQYTVDMYHQAPDAAAIRETAGYEVYPSAVTELPPEAHDPRQGNTPLGSGPFVFEEFQDAQYVVFSRNEDWWFSKDMKDWYDGPDNFPDQPAVEEVDISVVPDPASRSAALAREEIDMAYGLSASNLNNYRASTEYRTATSQAAGYLFMGFPIHDEPWGDPRIRQAVNKLIPRRQVSNRIFSGWENPAWVPLPPLAARDGTMDFDDLENELRHYNTFNLQEARELAQAAIDESDVEPPVEVTIETNSNNDDRVRVMQLVAQSMNQLDLFDVSVEASSPLQYISNLLSGTYHETGRMGMIGLSGGFDPHGYAKALHHPDNTPGCCNFANYNDEQMNEMLNNARYGVDVIENPNDRRRAYEDIWEYVLQENAYSYITHSTNVGVVNDDINGFNSYPSVQDIIGYGLYSPMEQQITYIDRD